MSSREPKKERLTAFPLHTTKSPEIRHIPKSVTSCLLRNSTHFMRSSPVLYYYKLVNNLLWSTLSWIFVLKPLNIGQTSFPYGGGHVCLCLVWNRESKAPCRYARANFLLNILFCLKLFLRYFQRVKGASTFILLHQRYK